MATEKYPQQNVNIPMDPDAVQAARDRGVPNKAVVQAEPHDGKGSKRQAGEEWIDDRKIILDAPPSPSEEFAARMQLRTDTRAVPTSYDPLKIYAVKLGEPAAHAGRVLSANSQYYMTGATCTEVSAAIIDAQEYADVPVEPDIAPSMLKDSGNNTKKRKG